MANGSRKLTKTPLQKPGGDLPATLPAILLCGGGCCYSNWFSARSPHPLREGTGPGPGAAESVEDLHCPPTGAGDDGTFPGWGGAGGGLEG